MKAVPVPHPVIPVLADRGGTQLKALRPVILVDTREQNPDLSRFEGWFAGFEMRALELGDYSIADWKTTAWSSAKALPIWFIRS